MTPPEKLAWLAKHESYHDNHVRYVSHDIKAWGYPIDRDKLAALLSTDCDVWEIAKLDLEVVNAQTHFDTGLDVIRLGRSGGHACFVIKEQAHNWTREKPSYRYREYPFAESKRDFENELWRGCDGLSNMTAYAVGLLWFDMTVNGIIHTAINFFNDLTVKERARTKIERIKRPVYTFGSKTDKDFKLTAWG
jgi:hypothetical protein